MRSRSSKGQSGTVCTKWRSNLSRAHHRLSHGGARSSKRAPAEPDAARQGEAPACVWGPGLHFRAPDAEPWGTGRVNTTKREGIGCSKPKAIPLANVPSTQQTRLSANSSSLVVVQEGHARKNCSRARHCRTSEPPTRISVSSRGGRDCAPGRCAPNSGIIGRASQRPAQRRKPRQGQAHDRRGSKGVSLGTFGLSRAARGSPNQIVLIPAPGNVEARSMRKIVGKVKAKAHFGRLRLTLRANTGEKIAIELSKKQAVNLYEQLICHAQLRLWEQTSVAFPE